MPNITCIPFQKNTLRRFYYEKGIDKYYRTGNVRQGMPIEQVQVLLGHSQIDTTLRYAMVNQNNVKASHHKYIG